MITRMRPGQDGETGPQVSGGQLRPAGTGGPLTGPADLTQRISPWVRSGVLAVEAAAFRPHSAVYYFCIRSFRVLTGCSGHP